MPFRRAALALLLPAPYDTAEWLLSHVSSNGRVGMIGVSNPARLVARAMAEHHPAVRACSPGKDFGFVAQTHWLHFFRHRPSRVTFATTEP